jgi:hypothetical protein
MLDLVTIQVDDERKKAISNYQLKSIADILHLQTINSHIYCI